MKTRLIFALVAAFTAPAFAQTDDPLAAATAFFTAWLEGDSERAAALLYFPPQAPVCLSADDKLTLAQTVFGRLPEDIRTHQGVAQMTSNASPTINDDNARLSLIITAKDGSTFPQSVTLQRDGDGWKVRL